MNRRPLKTFLLLAALALAWKSAGAWAVEPAGPAAVPEQQKLFPVPNLSAPPGSSFHPVLTPGPYPPFARPAATPTFNWGYFGAQTSVRGSRHAGYYGDVTSRFSPRGNR